MWLLVLVMVISGEEVHLVSRVDTFKTEMMCMTKAGRVLEELSRDPEMEVKQTYCVHRHQGGEQ